MGEKQLRIVWGMEGLDHTVADEWLSEKERPYLEFLCSFGEALSGNLPFTHTIEERELPPT
jgi:hypothetical protein